MSSTIQLTPHETMELHEILHNEVTAAKKLQASMAMATDQDLRSLMERSLQAKRNTLDGYQKFYSGQLQQQ
jgi:similar to spore coat protein